MERVIAGEFDSVRAAAREAGITLAQPRKTLALSENIDRVVAALKANYSPEQLHRIREQLAEESE